MEASESQPSSLTLPLLTASPSSLCYICHIYRNHSTFIKGISAIFQVVSNQKRSL